MLKFQDDYTTIIATFEDFILLVFPILCRAFFTIAKEFLFTQVQRALP